MLERAIWLKNRLAAMSPGEVLHRLREQARRRVSERRVPDFTADARRGETLPVIPGLAEGVRAVRERPGLLDDWREVHARARARRFRFLGLDWPEGLEQDRFWHRDPVTGGLWSPDAYCFAIDYRHAGDKGDVKYVAELGRLQFLQPIAALAHATGDEAAADFCLETLGSWTRDNPPFRGVHWASGIELALRVTSIAFVASLVPHDQIPADLRMRLRTTLAAHGHWLARFPSLFSSSNNHRVAELAGLYLLGRLVPDLPGAALWAKEGRDGLIAECPRQILEDGWGAEQSPTYAALSLEWFLLSALVGERTGDAFPEAFRSRIAKAGEALHAVTDAGGHQPRIGDDDDSAVTYSRTAPGGFVTSLLGAIANACARPDLSPPGLRPHLREALFGAPPAPAPLTPGVVLLPEGGIVAVRESVRGREALWVLDQGPLGFLSIAAHGHADALALWLHVDGRPVLVDAGTYLYHGGGRWRDAFRGTPAHNTLSVEGRDSSLVTGPFNWGRRATARLDALEDAPTAWRIEASHDGYEPAFGLRHRRRLERLGEGEVRLEDRLEGGGPPRAVAIAFLVDPDLEARADDQAVSLVDGSRTVLRIERGDGPLPLSLETGWISQRFGEKRETARIVLRGTLGPGGIVGLKLRVLPQQ